MNPGDRAVRWISNLTLCEAFQGQPFNLLPWQADGIIRPIFSGSYHRCLLLLPRKQAKTQISAAVGTYSILGSGKVGQAVLCAASDRDQASHLFDKCVTMITADPYLEKQVRIYSSKKRIEVKRGGNYLQVLSSEGRRQHGQNPSLVLFDEVAQQPNRVLYDSLSSAFGARKDYLLLMLSSAGNRRDSLLWDEYQYATKVRDGLIHDPDYLPIIYEAEQDADWTDEAVWHKAMPALSTFGNIDFIRSECRKAKEIPSEESKFRQLYLNQWVASSTKWLNRAKWDLCGQHSIDPDALKGRTCYGGLDLSNTSDITAFVLVFPMDDGTYAVLPHFWLPRDYAEERDRRGRTNYLHWASQGHITLTEGDAIDHDFIHQRVVELSDLYDIREIRIDPFAGTQPGIKLRMEGLNVCFMRQGTLSMNEPVKRLEVLTARDQLRHGSSPVLNWMADNAVVVRDSNDNIKFDKESSADKIDGMVALAMGLGAAMVDVHPEPAIF